MKKLLFAAYDMNVGGIETSLLTLLNYLIDTKKYDITLVLEKKQGIFLSQLDSKIKIIEYNPSQEKNILLRKVANFSKRLEFILLYKNKFDFSASFATYSLVSSFVARIASKNNTLWGHADYKILFNNNESEVIKFFTKLKYNKFKHIIFVSKQACKSFIEIFPESKKKVLHCNNLINDKKILELSEEYVEMEKDNTYTFINLGRHDEHQKRLTKIIKAAIHLKNDKLKFRILFIGEGKDTNIYKQQVEENNLQDVIKFLGVKKNPYPYLKLSDSVILTSAYEGYPVVFLEAFILNKPIITTNVSDAIEQIQNKFGQVVSGDEEHIYKTMKNFIQNGYTIKEKFYAKEYNEEILSKLYEIF